MAEVQRRTLSLADYDVPMIEVTGTGDGPLLTVIAGVHGCEYASMAGVRQWAQALAQRELRGRVRAVPVLNQPSFWTRTPFVVPEDGKNLNRCFPGNPDGTLAERLAYDAFTQLIAADDPAPDAAPRRAPTRLQRFLWLYSTSAGWWEPAVRPGEQVAEGQLLGTVSTSDGAEELQAVLAPVAGIPMFITGSPAVAADGLLLGLGAV